MRACYADPPYIGQAKNHYSNDPRCDEVDHQKLVLELEKFDCWALSCSSPTLNQILNVCPKDVRIGSWVKPFCAFKPNVNPAYAWEPVVFRVSRTKEHKRTREQRTIRDWHSENITLQTGCAGAKPEGFCYWVFEFLNLTPTDTLFDMYPGSGNVTTYWKKFVSLRTINPKIDVGAYVDGLVEEQLCMLPA